MIDFPADYFDGKRSQRQRVTVRVVSGRVVFDAEGATVEIAASSVAVKPRIGATPQRLELPGGGLLLTQSFDAVNSAFEVSREKTLAHRLESNLPFVFGSLVTLVIIFWAGYQYGVPWAAKQVSAQLPISIESRLGEEVLKSLNDFAMKPTKVDASRRAQLTALFNSLRERAGLPESVTLVFRGGGYIGPNALALPGGTVLVTDELLKLMDNDDGIAAVLAHELGHVSQRHSMRTVLQSSVIALASMAVFGDAASVTGIAVTLPTALVHSGYSRDFEREADQFAYELLRQTGRRPSDLGVALAALQSAHDKGTQDEDADKPPADVRVEAGAERSSSKPKAGRKRDVDMGYFSTHPATDERIRAANEASR